MKKIIEDFLKIYKFNESSSDSEECDESILDKSFFWLKTHGYWSIDFETKNGSIDNRYLDVGDLIKIKDENDKWVGEYIDANGDSQISYFAHLL